jgi:hypothetical protein
MQLGGCLCGAVRYRAEGEPLSSGICHCRTCRKTASAPRLPFASFPRTAVTFTLGRPAEFRSSPHVTRSFCGQCGSPLTYRNDDEPTTIDVMTCSLDDPEAFAPTAHVFAGEKLVWDKISGDLPAFRTTRRDGELISPSEPQHKRNPGM